MSERHHEGVFRDDPPPITPLPRRRASRRPFAWAPLFMLSILLLSGLLGNGPLALKTAFAATLQAPAKGVTTYQQFMKLAQSTPKTPQAPVRQLTAPTSKASQASTQAQKASTAKVLSSVQPAKMKPLRLSLPTTAIAANAKQAGALLKQTSSDQHLEVQVAPGALDATHASLAGGVVPASVMTNGLVLQITQNSGHYAGVSSVLGTYDFQLQDQQGYNVQGILGRRPITIIYHYQPAELKALGIDPGRVLLTWPSLITAARNAHKPTTGLSILMTNNAKTHTLTAQSTVVTASPFALASVPTVQQPPKAHLASVQGNSGNLTYSYPIQMPPGPGGFTPNLAFNYSTAMPNGRHSPVTPADNMGDGWTLGMGSITAENYPDSSAGGNSITRYSLNDPSGVSDLLVADPNNVGSFFTEHLSYEKILGLNMSSTTDTPSCFHVWDTSGTYYEYGCSSDSLQYTTDSSGNQTTYRWDVSRIVAPRNGSNAPSKQIKISYFQDMYDPGDNNGNTSVRDAVMAQIVYETVDPSTSPSTIKIVGSVDFQYRGDTSDDINTPSGSQSSSVVSYSATSNGIKYKCSQGTIEPTTQRCDTPIDFDSDTKAPTVMSTFSLERITTYVGADTANHPAYGYTFNYLDTPFVQISDPITQDDEYAAGEHLLTDITPIQYLGGTAHQLQKIVFGYTDSRTTPLTQNTYYDSQETNDNGSQYQVTTNWQYLNYYDDQNTNIGESVDYQTAFSNTHGTPYVTDSNGVVIDDRHDPFYCANHANDSDHSKRCSGNYAHPDDQTWSVQVVTNRESLGKDSSDPNLQPATYNYTYTLGVWGNYKSDFSGSGSFCTPAKGSPLPAGQSDCVFDTFIPGTTDGNTDQDWQDYYHGEFRGFGKVYTVSPAGNLDVQTFFTPESWGTPESDSQNYQSSQMIKDDKYMGDGEVDGHMISETVNQYSGTSDFLPSGASAYSTACMDTSIDNVYTPCEIVQVFSKTTTYEQNGTATPNAPWVQTTNTYDDYNTSGGLQTGGYHNLLQEQTTSSNAPTTTKKSTYAVNNSSGSNFTYHTVNKVKHSEIDDASGHVWQCQDTTYDEGVSGIHTPAAGEATTVKTYSDCSHQSSTALTTYTAYDGFGNAVGTVDAFGAANSNLYNSNGCTLAMSPAVLSPSWTMGHYTTCSVFDSYAAQTTSQQDVLRQNTTATYDDNEGRLQTASTDVNGQATSVSYSYDSNGNQTLQVKKPGETGSYTSQSSTNSTCTFGSNLPCYEIDGVSSQYPNAVNRTFYDAQGQETETRKPLDATHDIITFTVHNELNDSVFVSEPFRVANGTSWIDPSTATDGQGNIPTGTITITDPLGRTIATRDAIEGTAAEPGITCASGNLQGTWTSCVGYGLGSPNPNSSTQYDYAVTYDANNHMSVTFKDGTENTRFVKEYSASSSINNNITSATETQYNALNKPTAVIVTDMVPQAGQTITSVITTATYDDLGRQTSLTDPDRGTHTYTYDADGRQITDVSGSRTIGTSYDLLGRALCVQDAVPTTDGSGSCSSGSHPMVQNSYGTSYLQLSGTTNYITGQLGQSVATTYYPDGSSVATTEQFEYDQRGRTIAANLNMSVPSSWNVTTALPTYQQTQTYNDNDQLMMTQTTIGGKAGYTFSQVYDGTTGNLTGLSNNSTGVANLASLSFNTGGLISDVNFQTTNGTALADDQLSYDGNQRPAGANVTWQNGSGASGTVFSTSRGYDPNGNVVSSSLIQSVVSGQANSGGSETQNFCNDEQNRLVWAGNNGAQPSAGNGTCGTATPGNSLNGANYNNSYVYTHLGHIWQAPLNGTGSPQQYLYCDSSHPHQLTGVYPIGTTCSTTSGVTALYSASYDSWGNMTARTYGTTTAMLSYNISDQLVKWDGNDSSNVAKNRQEWYAYDAKGNRVLLKDTSGGNKNITTYAFGQEEHTYDGSGNSTGNTYYYSLSGRLIGQFNGTNTQFELTDELGSVLAAFSSIPGSASVLANQAYGPYGNKLYSAGTMGTNKGYTGQYNDPMGLDYYNARYYDPVVGRFVSADTVQGNSKGMDPYNYVGSNPETHNDPTGQCWPFCTILAGIVAGAVIGAVVGTAVQAVSNVVQHKAITDGLVESAVNGLVSGAITGGIAGSGIGLGALAVAGVGALSGSLGGAAGKAAENVVDHKPLGEGVLSAGAVGLVTGGLTAGLFEVLGPPLQKVAGKAIDGVRGVLGDEIGDLAGIAGSKPSYAQIRSRIPTNAVQAKFGTTAAIPEGDVKYTWNDPNAGKTLLYAHGINSRAPAIDPATSQPTNSSQGWTWRMNVPPGSQNFLDTSGNVAPNSNYQNDTHLPMQNPTQGWFGWWY